MSQTRRIHDHDNIGSLTECPKCGAAVEHDAKDCVRCGVVFAKFELRKAEEAEAAAFPVPQPMAPAAAMRNYDPDRGAQSVMVWWGRAIFLALLVFWTFSLGRQPMRSAGDSFLHLPNLIFHEAGHFIFAPLGRFMTVLGGSLTQCLVPVIFGVAFARQRQWFAVAVMTWWFGENLMDLAPYIADARALRLVLLGGKTGAEVEGHDWEYILNALGIAHHDITIGTWAFRLGLFLMVGSLAAAAYTLFKPRAARREP